MVAHNQLLLPAGYLLPVAYENRGAPTIIHQLMLCTGSSDSTKDGLWISTAGAPGSTSTDWERLENALLDGQTLAAGDLFYWDAANGRLAKVGIGTEGYVLKSVSGVPAWAVESGASVSELSDLSDVSSSTPTSGNILVANGTSWASSSLTSTETPTAIHDDTAGEINAITEKASPVNADLLIIEDSEASNAKKKVQLGNLPGGTGNGNIKVWCWVSNLDTSFLLSTTPIAFTWSTDRYDPDAMHDTSTNKQDIVVDTTGDNYYLELEITLQRRTASNDSAALIQVYVNDTAKTDAIARCDIIDGPNTGSTFFLEFWLGSLTASDTVEIRGADANDPQDVNILDATSNHMKLLQIV